MKKLTNILTIIALVVIIVLIGTISFGYYKKITMEVKNPIVTIEVKDFGTIKLELYPASKDRNRPSCVKIPTEVK